jgi:hypothetical protein
MPKRHARMLMANLIERDISADRDRSDGSKHERRPGLRKLQEMTMRTPIVLIASLLALVSPAGAPTAFARLLGGVTAAPPLVDTGSEAYPSSPTGADGRDVSVTAAPPAVDTGSQAYPSSATGAGEPGNYVIAGGAMVPPPTGDGMPESVNSFPPGFTDPYMAHH